jgi:hypothetical protein
LVAVTVQVPAASPVRVEPLSEHSPVPFSTVYETAPSPFPPLVDKVVLAWKSIVVDAALSVNPDCDAPVTRN